jgi:hypothetical protein
MNPPTTVVGPLRPGLYPGSSREHSRVISARLSAGGLDSGATWRISPLPFLLSPETFAAIERLGSHLLDFTRALNRLYYDSVRGAQPAWVAEYLDQGKPEELVAFARMNRFRADLPGVIRPDLLLTETGLMISELDSVPGGIGITGCMSQIYSDLGWPILGGRNGMVEGFAAMIRNFSGDREVVLAIMVSEEAKDYRPEMAWLTGQLCEVGLPAYLVDPKDVSFTEESLHVPAGQAVSVLYRFFELFDLKNIPKVELFFYAAKKGRVRMTPPAKPWLEEKMAFSLLHHPVLEGFWRETLDVDTFSILSSLMPKTWILDPRPVPPHAVIPGLAPGGRPLSNFLELAGLSQKERRFVIKPSGFSELAWGSRGVSVGHDMGQPQWGETLKRALSAFPASPHILQEFRKARRVLAEYHDPVSDEIIKMPGRVRLSPYYFVSGDEAQLGGILATVVPLDKKLIHGMTDAIMAPCALGSETAPTERAEPS